MTTAKGQSMYLRHLGMLMSICFVTAVLFASLAGSLGFIAMLKKREIEAQRLILLKQQIGTGTGTAALPDDEGAVGGGDGPGVDPLNIDEPHELSIGNASVSAK